MGQGARRGKVVALVLAVALVAVAVPLAVPVWWWVSTTRVEMSSHIPGRPLLFRSQRISGWRTVKRWSRPDVQGPPSSQADLYYSHGKSVAFYSESGFKAWEADCVQGRPIHFTVWSLEGKVLYQDLYEYNSGSRVCQQVSSPPWRWSVGDQMAPSDPQWIAEHGK